jgi:hypothetical protein
MSRGYYCAWYRRCIKLESGDFNLFRFIRLVFWDALAIHIDIRLRKSESKTRHLKRQCECLAGSAFNSSRKRPTAKSKGRRGCRTNRGYRITDWDMKDPEPPCYSQKLGKHRWMHIFCSIFASIVSRDTMLATYKTQIRWKVMQCI